MNPNIPRAAIIGLGGIGAVHRKVLARLAGEGLCDLVAGCDPNIEKIRDTPDGIPEKLALFSSAEEMLGVDRFDYMVVASPIHLHFEQTAQALNHGSFVYLEKPPVATYAQLSELLQHPRADQVAVGFQMLHAPPLRALKAKLDSGELGTVREIWASGLWPRNTSYYERASWAGRMHLSRRTVFDGPLTNALAHIVQSAFFLAGKGGCSCARPRTASGFYGRARPIESYDFAWIKGRTEDDIPYSILAGHCSDRIVPWKVSVRTDKGIFSVEEKEMAGTEELLRESHRLALAVRQGTVRSTSQLADCIGYSMATCAGLVSSLGIHRIPPIEIRCSGSKIEKTYHVERIVQMIRQGQGDNLFMGDKAEWIKLGEEIDCREALAKPSPLFQPIVNK